MPDVFLKVCNIFFFFIAMRVASEGREEVHMHDAFGQSVL